MKYLFIRTLYRIKDSHPKLWSVIENINSLLFGMLYFKPFSKRLQLLLNEQENNLYQFRFLVLEDTYALQKLLVSLEPAYRQYFKPHRFDEKTLQRQLRNKALIRMGIFSQNQMVGYFFIRAGINRKCFVGRLVHKSHRRKGLGKAMNHIMYHAAWQSGFRVFATLSPTNQFVMQSHKNNPYIHMLNDLPGNYKIVEFLKPRS